MTDGPCRPRCARYRTAKSSFASQAATATSRRASWPRLTPAPVGTPRRRRE
jgi:hypothetical protein